MNTHEWINLAVALVALAISTHNLIHARRGWLKAKARNDEAQRKLDQIRGRQ